MLSHPSTWIMLKLTGPVLPRHRHLLHSFRNQRTHSALSVSCVLSFVQQGGSREWHERPRGKLPTVQAVSQNETMYNTPKSSLWFAKGHTVPVLNWSLSVTATVLHKIYSRLHASFCWLCTYEVSKPVTGLNIAGKVSGPYEAFWSIFFPKENAGSCSTITVQCSKEMELKLMLHLDVDSSLTSSGTLTIMLALSR